MTNQFTIPKEVSRITSVLKNAGFKAYLVGGCVRDLIRDHKPKDWDVTTSANPDQIQGLFAETFYTNEFGTVGVVNEGAEDETLKVVEVTPFRIEGKYIDGRRPETVEFSDRLEDDLKRRDFTINAVAFDVLEVGEVSKGHLIDRYKGQVDIKDKTIRAVGTPDERFSEDYLRILRAVRLATELGFDIEPETRAAISAHAAQLKHISQERIRDEFIKIVMSDNPLRGFNLAHELGVLKYVFPELEEGIQVKQNGDHIYDVWEHNLRALQHAADRKWPLHIRLGALFHDVSKPETRRWSKEKNDYTFYGHDVVGARKTKKIMERMKFPKDLTDKVVKFVRYHLFFTDIDKITLSAVRRLVNAIGQDLVWDLMKVRACDRIGMGRPKEKPYRLRKYEAMIEEAMRAPVSVGMLKISGDELMSLINEKPGPRVGWILHALLEDVLDDPDRNTREYLEKRARELAKLSDSELSERGKTGQEKRGEAEEAELKKIRRRHGVQ